MSNTHYTGRVRAVEEYDGWALYPEGALTRGVQPLAKGIDEGPDGGEKTALRLASAWNNMSFVCKSEPFDAFEAAANLADEHLQLLEKNAAMSIALAAIKETLENNPLPGYAPILAIIDGVCQTEKGVQS